MEYRGHHGLREGNLALAAVLILLGSAFLVGQIFGISLGRFLWPFFIIAPGALLLAVSLTVQADPGEALAILGSIVTAVGAVLFWQNLTGHWASWAYAWALVGPVAAGFGLLVHGTLKGRPKKVKDAKDLIRIGGIMFIVGAVFFELVIGISGFGLGRFGWPLLLIGVGAYALVRNLQWGRREE